MMESSPLYTMIFSSKLHVTDIYSLFPHRSESNLFSSSHILFYFRYHIDKKEWKQISSPNSPTPRCSHQAITYKYLSSFSHTLETLCTSLEVNSLLLLKISSTIIKTFGD